MAVAITADMYKELVESVALDSAFSPDQHDDVSIEASAKATEVNLVVGDGGYEFDLNLTLPEAKLLALLLARGIALAEQYREERAG